MSEWIRQTTSLLVLTHSLKFRKTRNSCFSEKALLFGTKHRIPQTSICQGTSFLSSHHFWYSISVYFLSKQETPLQTGFLCLDSSCLISLVTILARVGQQPWLAKHFTVLVPTVLCSRKPLSHHPPWHPDIFEL